MYQYLELLERIKQKGVRKEDRTGTGTLSVFGAQLKFDLSQGFPAVTTKKLFFKGVVAELLFFLSGETNVKFLHEHGVYIWDDWADAHGNIGKLYPHQWRNWNDEGRDQIAQVLEQIKIDPSSRRHVVCTWNVSQLDEMRLAPCHPLFMFYVADNKLSCQFVMRSSDAFLGLPFNIASYAVLTHLMARECGLEVGELIYTGNDVHLYLNHLDQVDEQLTREPKPAPQLWLNPDKKRVDDFTIDDIKLIGYKFWPAIKAPIAV